jgi:hypothetical protein
VDDTVARGPGPTWLRWALVVVAFLYFVGLLTCSSGWKTVPQSPVLKQVGFFVEAAGLFPKADVISFEYKLEAWSCERRRWEKMDPRPYFPIEADNKESRFQRLVWFFRKSANLRTVMNALDEYVVAHHAGADDAVSGVIGGIRVYEVWRDLPPPGETTARYAYAPLRPLQPNEQRKDIFNTRTSVRKQRCKART